MKLNREYIQQLLETNADDHHISLYMPTHAIPGRETRQDSIRLKTLLNDVRDQLLERGLGHGDVETLLRPATDLLDDETFWKNQNHGLVLFLRGGELEIHHVPAEMPARTFIGDRFYIRPLMPFINADGRFYILALSQQRIRFFEATRYHIEPITLPDMPTSLDEALQFDEDEPQLQHHSGRKASVEQSEIYHTQDPQDQHKTNILRLMQMVDNHVTPYLRTNSEKAPLMLAGVEFIRALYHQANHYQYLVEEKAIAGNPDNVKDQELHAQALGFVEDYFESEQKAEYRAFCNQIATEATSSDLRTLVPAAHHGQIDTLFIKQNGQHWGRYDEPSDTFELHDDYTLGSVELLDLAAAQTLKHGGAVFVLAEDEMPVDAPAAATLRF